MRTILITGCASGVGAAIAEELADSGVRLILHTGSNAAGLDAVVKICRDSGATVDAVVGDLADSAVISALIAACEQGSCLDGLVLNAGFPNWRAFGELDAEGLNESLQVVTAANFQLLTDLVPLLKSAEHGKVIGVSSFLAHKFKVGDCVVPASATAKAALEALIKSFAAQYAADGICANVIVPGYIKKNAPNHTPPSEATLNRILGRIPAGRLGMPPEVGYLVSFLLSNKANYITGQLIHIDGGMGLQ